MNKKIPIFFSFDNNYVIPAAVAFFSLFNSAKKNITYQLFVLHTNIDQQNQYLLLDIVKRWGKDSELRFINTNNFLRNRWENGNWEGKNKLPQFTVDTINRCFGSVFFPQFNKIIYSDVDVLFVGDISELIDLDLSSTYIGAVKNAFMKWDKNELSHLKSEHYNKLKDSYFAGGIWVLNLKKIREDKLNKKMMEIIDDDTIIKRWNDQDIMNIACDNKVQYIPLNYISYPYLFSRIEENPSFESHYSREELYDSLINPKIIHFAGIKPWNNRDIPYAELWWTYLKYLDLDVPSTFKNNSFLKENNERNRRKYRQYKKLFNLMIGFSILFVIIIFFLIHRLI